MTGASQTRRRLVAAAAVAVGALILIVLIASGGSSSKHSSPASSTKAGSGGSSSSSSSKVTVPGVAGAKARDAEGQLRGLGLDVGTKRRYSSNIPRGSVVKTDPPGGSLVARGAHVDLIVSRGTKPPPTPAVATPTPGTGASGGAGNGGTSPCPPGQFVRADGSCGAVPRHNGGAPANTPQGRHQLHQNPDCQHAPPPPPGYKGPVQC